MGRQWHETQFDKDRENRFVEFIARNMPNFSFQIPPQPPDGPYTVDRIVYDNLNRPVFCLEVKCLNVDPMNIPSLMLSANKVEKCHSLANLLGVDFIFAVLFAPDSFQWGWANFTQGLEDDTFPSEFGGRTKTTRDAGDIEPVFRVPISQVKLFRTDCVYDDFGLPVQRRGRKEKQIVSPNGALPAPKKSQEEFPF